MGTRIAPLKALHTTGDERYSSLEGNRIITVQTGALSEQMGNLRKVVKVPEEERHSMHF